MLTEFTVADLFVIGVGYNGLYSALLAKESDPTLDVILLAYNYEGATRQNQNGQVLVQMG